MCSFPLGLPALELVVTSQTCPKNNIESGVPYVIVPPRTRILLDLTRRRRQGTACLFVPVRKANLKAGPLAPQTFRARPDTAHQPILYAQGCRKPPLCSCFTLRKKRDWFLNVGVNSGITLEETLLQKGCWKLQTVNSAFTPQVCTQCKSRWL